MSEEEIKTLLLKILADIAPEAELEAIDPKVNFRDQIDFDSVDFLNFITAVQKELRLDIPELDYPKLSNLSGCITYFTNKSAN